MSYLDKKGVQYLWNKIKAYVDSKILNLGNDGYSIIYNGIFKGGNYLSLDCSSYKRLRVYVNLNKVNTEIFELDLTKNFNVSSVTYPYRTVHLCGAMDADGRIWRIDFGANPTKTMLFLSFKFGNNAINSNSFDNNADAYIYKIEGYK